VVTDLLSVVLGITIIVWARRTLPRQLKRVGGQAGELLERRRFQMTLKFLQSMGILLIIIGVVFVATE
jgi:hypothetical protein